MYLMFLFVYLPFDLIRLEGNAEDQILGKWISLEGNLIVLVYKERSDFKARVFWFDDSDDKTNPMNLRTDSHNLNPKLRNRKIIGMEVLHDLKYHSSTNSWEDGIIYDANSGREWNSCVSLTKDGLLQVKGYWHFKFISQTITFIRYKS